MSTIDKVSISLMASMSAVIVTVGGVFHPNTLAGVVAKFMFSLN